MMTMVIVIHLVVLGTHKEKLVAASSPRCLHMLRLGLVVLGSGHHHRRHDSTIRKGCLWARHLLSIPVGSHGRVPGRTVFSLLSNGAGSLGSRFNKGRPTSIYPHTPQRGPKQHKPTANQTKTNKTTKTKQTNNKQTNTQTNKQTDRQTDRQTN